jgi:signal transduction histidine kinase
LRIEVVPPLWMTPWFRALMLLGVVAIAIGAHRVRTSALERRNRELQALQAQREKALAEAGASQAALEEAYGRLRGLTRRLEAAKEDERKRIARELHDEMGQALTAAKINLQILAANGSPLERTRRIEDAVGMLDRMIGHVRTMSLALRPPLLDELGLLPALRSYLEAQTQRAGVRFDLTAIELPALAPEIAIVAFRAVQEAVTNVIRHAGASNATVALEPQSGSIEITVRDDGRGFDVGEMLERAARGHHLGLLGIRERVEGLGGTVEIVSALDHGTEVRVSVPLS